MLSPLISICLCPVGSSRVKFPLTSVVVAIHGSFKIRLMPIMGSPVLKLVTCPLSTAFRGGCLIRTSPTLYTLFSEDAFSGSPLR